MTQSLALILAAGEGTRMKSKFPKVTHTILGRPMVQWSVVAAYQAGCSDVAVIVGRQKEMVEDLLAQHAQLDSFPTPICIEQTQRLGTGHAVKIAQSYIEQVIKQSVGVSRSSALSVVILNGDTPLITPQTIQKLIDMQQSSQAALTLLSMQPPCCSGYGRIVRDEQNNVCAIVEEKDCTLQQKSITECNAGIYCFNAQDLLDNLHMLSTQNAQQEYYITDLVDILVRQHKVVTAYCVSDYTEALGVNARDQLAIVQKYMQQRINEQHMQAGVSMIDPQQVWIGPRVRIQQDTVLYPQCFLYGATSIGSDCIIEPQTHIEDSVIGDNCHISYSVIKKAVIDDRVEIGPFAYVRPKTHVLSEAKIGTHVEIKESTVGKATKIPHLSYIGNATIGEHVNIGAGSITCNYDGTTKHSTHIGDNVFIGSDTMLVAPVTIGDRAITGASSCITKDVPQDALALERTTQTVIDSYTKKRS